LRKSALQVQRLASGDVMLIDEKQKKSIKVKIGFSVTTLSFFVNH
jgi:hypothetical protein